ncbi:MAG: T9SS type A sorting domain-containing protein [Bacteroidetes bacterium]|nr:T9SS type A sorting domain-containing protein [Bacteroidota bacterium]
MDGLICTIPYNKIYFLSSNNEEHIAIEQRNGNWVAAEINLSPVTADCSALCNLQISGNDYLCNSESYSLPAIAGVTIDWTVSNYGIVTPTSGTGNSITLTLVANGTVTLYANVASPCGNFILRKQITVGLETGNIPILGLAANANVCASTMFNVYTGVWGSYNWTVNGGHIISGQGTPEIYVQVNNTPNYGYYVGVAKINQCGLSGDLGAIGGSIVFCEGGGGGNITSIRGKQDSLNTIMSEYNNNVIAVFPNPTQNNITITLSADSIDIPHTVILVKDVYGRIVKKVTTGSYYNTISLTNVASGIYFIDIYDGKKRVMKKIVKLK